MKQKILAILTALGFTEKAQAGNLSSEELKALNEECQKQFQMNFSSALEAASKEQEKVLELEEGQQKILKAMFGKEEKAETKGAQTTEVKASENNEKIIAGITEMQEKIKKLEAQAEDGKGKKIEPVAKVIPITGGAHTAKYLFGIEASLFAMEKPWNAVAATRQPLELIAATRGLSADWEEYRNSFKEEVNTYGKSLAKRIGQLLSENGLNIKMTDIDFSGFTGTGWGDDYVVRRQDALIAYIRTLNSIKGIFKTRYGVQNKEVLTNSFLRNFSSSYKSGHTFKGGVSVEPLEAQVYDLMIKHKFTNLKDLEKEYIGYLNTEGSDPMKWTWIEWVVARILEVAMNEKNERGILGKRIEPTTDYYRHHLHGSNGVLTQLRLWEAENRLQAWTGYAYTKTTILSTVESWIAAVYEKLPSLKGMRLHMNEKHIPWYNAAYRDKYGKDLDFKGAQAKLMDYPDVEILDVPNMGNSTMMILTIPGNIEIIENVAGEMEKMYMQRDLEELIIASYWKEGVTAYMVGKKFASAALLAADDYQNQYIFFTDDSVEQEADATTMDATKGHWFKTVENSQATAITDITGAKTGVVYRIVCGATGNASTVAKAGKFSLVDAWTPQAVGDYLEVYLYQNPDDNTDVKNGKFINVSRKVNGVIS